MLTLLHLDPGAYVTKPWKNGLGQTLEIAADHESPLRWRVSSADVPSSGPFSEYAGYERTLVLLAGGPMTLTHDGVQAPSLHPLDVEVFQGENVTSAHVETPARDLNVFTLRGKAEARVAVHRIRQGSAAPLFAEAHEHFLYCVSGDVVVAQEGDPHRTIALRAGDTLRASRGAEGSAVAELDVRAWSNAALVFIALRLL